jgi:VWFA-related protein
MRITAKLLTAGLFTALLALSPSSALDAQAPGQQPVPQPTFRASVDLITTDLIVRDAKTDQFVADLKADEVEVFEDGVKQKIASLIVSQGGRVYNIMSPPPAPPQEGIILPPRRPSTDTSGRIFILFIDDLHLDFRMTPRTRDLLQRMLRSLIHDGDMFGIVSTGHSSISEQLTYDRQILESAIERVTGGGLRPKEIMQAQSGPNGPTELRHRAHVAFSTAYDLMRNLEKVQNRRKAVIYLSSGYDFDPFVEGRFEEQARRMGLSMDCSSSTNESCQSAESLKTDPFYMQTRSQQELSAADLFRELGELTKAANRANATLYTIDPRGLVAGPDMDDDVSTTDWNAFVRETQDSLRVLAEETGGIAVVNQNDFDKALKRIDNETSDYYVLGYYSNNPDPLKRTRRIDVRTTRPGVTVRAREEYSFRLPPPVTPPR